MYLEGNIINQTNSNLLKPHYLGIIAVLTLTYSNQNSLTLPTAKAGGFLLQPLLHWPIPFGTATSYTVSTSYLMSYNQDILKLDSPFYNSTQALKAIT